MHFRRLERIGVLFRQRHCLFLQSAGWCCKVARGCWVCICFFPVLLFFPIHAFLCWICSTTTPIFSHRRGTHKLFLEHRWWRVLILPLGFTRSLSFNVSSSCGFDKYLQNFAGLCWWKTLYVRRSTIEFQTRVSPNLSHSMAGISSLVLQDRPSVWASGGTK
jgi:hypothetical protein